VRRPAAERTEALDGDVVGQWHGDLPGRVDVELLEHLDADRASTARAEVADER
jgi:hypothetical protein